MRKQIAQGGLKTIPGFLKFGNILTILESGILVYFLPVKVLVSWSRTSSEEIFFVSKFSQPTRNGISNRSKDILMKDFSGQLQLKNK
jgi:hypothetical protein